MGQRRRTSQDDTLRNYVDRDSEPRQWHDVLMACGFSDDYAPARKFLMRALCVSAPCCECAVLPGLYSPFRLAPPLLPSCAGAFSRTVVANAR